MSEVPKTTGTGAAVAVAALLMSGVPALAETLRLGDLSVSLPEVAGYAACMDRAEAAGPTDAGMARCADAEADAWDRRLNAAYARLRATLPPADAARLRDFQRLWAAERDAACRQDPEGGTAGLSRYATCRLRETATRAAALEDRLRAEAPRD
jgi:uncharacterized protein YecT (DUF1311 family)